MFRKTIETQPFEEVDKSFKGIFGVQTPSPSLHQAELRLIAQFFYFCLKGIPAIIIPSLRDIN